jgi:prepilin-type N-terminal cleavage/methylation domain-containing protein
LPEETQEHPSFGRALTQLRQPKRAHVMDGGTAKMDRGGRAAAVQRVVPRGDEQRGDGMRRKEKGFTLMELMVVIVIVAILAAVAVPLYINYVKDAQRTEAKGAIGAIITGEQTYYQRKGTYTTDTTQVNVDLSDLSNNWSFAISAPDNGTLANGFKVTANGIGSNTNGLKVTCNYIRGQDPLWTEQ